MERDGRGIGGVCRGLQRPSWRAGIRLEPNRCPQARTEEAQCGLGVGQGQVPVCSHVVLSPCGPPLAGACRLTWGAWWHWEF